MTNSTCFLLTPPLPIYEKHTLKPSAPVLSIDFFVSHSMKSILLEAKILACIHVLRLLSEHFLHVQHSARKKNALKLKWIASLKKQQKKTTIKSN